MNYKIISKYIKDISFEIPNTPAFVMLEKEISNYGLNFDIKSNSYKKNICEVNTLLRIIPNQDVKHKILTEITLAALVSIDANFDNKNITESVEMYRVCTQFSKCDFWNLREIWDRNM